MKTYIYSVTKETTKYGWISHTKIHRVINNIPKHVDTISYDSQSCKGDASEVFTYLYKQKLITKAEYNRFDGYYAGKDVRIMEV